MAGNSKSGGDKVRSAGRRRLLRTLAVTGGAIAGSTLRIRDWRSPLIEVGVLPAHAHFSIFAGGRGWGHHSGNYSVSQTDPPKDPCNHLNFTGNPVDGNTWQITISSNDNVAIKGLSFKDSSGNDHEFVPLTGTVDPLGNITASGSGEVAGFQNVSVSFMGMISSSGTITGSLSYGVMQELPGECPIDFSYSAKPLFSYFGH